MDQRLHLRRLFLYHPLSLTAHGHTEPYHLVERQWGDFDSTQPQRKRINVAPNGPTTRQHRLYQRCSRSHHRVEDDVIRFGEFPDKKAWKLRREFGRKSMKGMSGVCAVSFVKVQVTGKQMGQPFPVRLRRVQAGTFSLMLEERQLGHGHLAVLDGVTAMYSILSTPVSPGASR